VSGTGIKRGRETDIGSETRKGIERRSGGSEIERGNGRGRRTGERRAVARGTWSAERRREGTGERRGGRAHQLPPTAAIRVRVHVRRLDGVRVLLHPQGEDHLLPGGE
jgi:hypothetical protein